MVAVLGEDMDVTTKMVQLMDKIGDPDAANTLTGRKAARDDQ